jgi:hypothetical protein
MTLLVNISCVQASEHIPVLNRVNTSTGLQESQKAQVELQRAEAERAKINQKIAVRVSIKNMSDQVYLIDNQNNYKKILLECHQALERKFDTKDTKKLNREDKIDKMHTLRLVRDSLYPVLIHKEDKLISDELLGMDQATQKQNCFFMPSSEKIMTKGQGLMVSIQNRLNGLAQENNAPSTSTESNTSTKTDTSASSVMVVVHAHPVEQEK